MLLCVNCCVNMITMDKENKEILDKKKRKENTNCGYSQEKPKTEKKTAQSQSERERESERFMHLKKCSNKSVPQLSKISVKMEFKFSLFSLDNRFYCNFIIIFFL